MVWYSVLLLLLQIFSSRCVSGCPADALVRRLASGVFDHFTCNVTDFGAAGDGATLDTDFIQAAIDACAQFGTPGNVSLVYIPPGRFLTGTLFVRSNMVVFVDRRATLLGSPRRADYPAGDQKRWYVLLAEGAVNVGLTGGGEVNGQSSKFVARFDPRKNWMVSWNSTGDGCLGDECRPRLVGFVNSRNVSVWDIHLREPAYWCLHLVNTDNSCIRGVDIYGDFDTPNNDGIDVDGSNNTFISGCRIDTGDDAICPKTTYGPVVNLTVTSCTIRTKSSAIKLGSATSYNFSGLRFDNITIVDSHRGLGIQLRDSGFVYDTTFSNIVMSTRYYDPSWWGRAEPIYVTACPRDAETKVGSVQGVKFINIRATSESGIFLAGSGKGMLEGLQIVNATIRLKRWTAYAAGLQDYRPGCEGLVQHNTTSAIFMRNVDNLMLKNVSIQGDDDQWDVPMEFGPHSVTGISFNGLHLSM